ncbi:MAG: radical SAM family heme chaperone HemW [Capsulimonadaceae bacterium]|nr:radical SAM family heme chaperone HemW [Capsulimonadaceae bacterium]
MTQGCYVHIPFCAHKCAYCDFNSYGGHGAGSIERYVDAIVCEIARADCDGAIVDTVFFGGGTPTAIPAESEARILHAVRKALPVAADAEITTEANPGSSDVAGLAVLRAAGFNRISFGVQSFDDDLLRGVDRIHSAQEARDAVRAARHAGFENVSIDLMYGLPRQTLPQWVETVEQAIDLGVDHLSMYSLIVEQGTGFGVLAAKGRLPLPGDDLTADMFEFARVRAAEAGYGQYEISNYTLPGRECRQNVHYWRNEPYHGFGAGAVSYQDGVRRTRLLTPSRYSVAALAGADLTAEAEVPTVEQQMAETMMLGLRMTREGVDLARFRQRFNVDPRDKWPVEIARLTSQGLIEVEGDVLRLTYRGVFLGGEAMIAFI